MLQVSKTMMFPFAMYWRHDDVPVRLQNDCPFRSIITHSGVVSQVLCFVNVVNMSLVAQQPSATTRNHSATTGNHWQPTGNHRQPTGNHSATTGNHGQPPATTGNHRATIGNHSATTGNHSVTSGNHQQQLLQQFPFY